MIRYIDGAEYIQLARARPAGPPFDEQDGSLIGVDYQTWDGGGMCNVRFTRQQAEALRDVLHAYLTRGPLTVEILKDKGRILRREFDRWAALPRPKEGE